MTVSRVSAFILSNLFLVLISTALARADSFNIDPVHSSGVFNIQHMKAGFTWGLIGGPTGAFSYDAGDPTKLSFDISVSLDHLDTQSAQRDADIKGPDWFNAKQFPTIAFKSTSAKKTGDNTFEVTGDLTLHGVTKSITVTMTMTGTGPGMQGETRAGFETTFSIKRSDYDMKALIGPVGDDVGIVVALEGIKQ